MFTEVLLMGFPAIVKMPSSIHHDFEKLYKFLNSNFVELLEML